MLFKATPIYIQQLFIQTDASYTIIVPSIQTFFCHTNLLLHAALRWDIVYSHDLTKCTLRDTCQWSLASLHGYVYSQDHNNDTLRDTCQRSLTSLHGWRGALHWSKCDREHHSIHKGCSLSPKSSHKRHSPLQ